MRKKFITPFILGTYLLGTTGCGGWDLPNSRTAATVTAEQTAEWEGGLRYAGPGGSAYTEFAAEPPSERASLLREKWGRIVAGIAVIGAGAGLVIGGGAAVKTGVEAKAGAAVAGAVAEGVGQEILTTPTPEELTPPSSITPQMTGEIVADQDVLGEGIRYITRSQLQRVNIPANYIEEFLDLQNAIRNWHEYYMQDIRNGPEAFLGTARTAARRLAIKFRNSPRFSRPVFRSLADQLDELANWADEEIKMFHHPQRSSSGDPR